MAINQQERRKEGRVSYTHLSSYFPMGQAGRSTGFQNIRCNILNLSSTGMRIRVEDLSLEEGMVLRAQIPVTNSDILLPVLSQVIWFKGKKSGSCEVGLRFLL